MAMLFSGTVLGAGKEGPGMAEGQPVAGLQTGGVIRRDSGAEEEKAESGDGKTENQVSQVMDGKPDLPGVSVDSLEGLTYDIRQLNVSKAEDVEDVYKRQNLPRPRDIASPDFVKLRNEVTDLIKWW